jgi:hypothetical protein
MPQRARGHLSVEQWKWGTPVWSSRGNVVALGAFQKRLKINFFRGAALEDPAHLFNAGLDAKATRAIDLRKGDRLDEAAFKDLIRAAVTLDQGNSEGGPPRKKPTRKR